MNTFETRQVCKCLERVGRLGRDKSKHILMFADDPNPFIAAPSFYSLRLISSKT